MSNGSFQMMLHYNIANYSDVNEFLALLARRQGRLKKHGVPDVNRAAKMMLQDWNLWVISHLFSQSIYRYGIMWGASPGFDVCYQYVMCDIIG